MCKILNIKRTSYYSWLKSEQGPQSKKWLVQDEKIKPLIQQVYLEYKGYAGAPRIKKWLNKYHNLNVSHKRIYRLLAELNLKVKQTKKFRNKDVSHINDSLISKNLLNRNFSTPGPNQKWVSDITYIQTKQGWLFLVVFIDLYSRRVVGWSAGTHMRAELVTQALLMEEA